MVTKMADQEKQEVKNGEEVPEEAPAQAETDAPGEAQVEPEPVAQEGAQETTPVEPENLNNNAEETPAASDEVAEAGQEQTEEQQAETSATPQAEDQPEQNESQPEVEENKEEEEKTVEGEEKEEDKDGKSPEGDSAPTGEETEEVAQEQEDQPQAEDTQEEGQKSPVPQSDTFADGERAESPVAVGEKLSREASPREDQTAEDQTTDDQPPPATSPPIPGTPERVSVIGEEDNRDEDEEDDDEEEEEDDEEEYEDDEEEYEEEEPQFDREQLIEKYHQALAERQQLQEQNYQLQHKLAEYFQKKKSDDTRQDMDKNVTDQEQRYLKYMANLDDLRTQDTEERELFKAQIEELKDRCQEKQERVNDERLKFMEFKKQIGLGAVNSRSGKPIPPKDIETYLGTESRKESEVVCVRLENIKLKNKLKKKEMQLKSKEELAEGLHLIDFEQLKIENQTYNEKIEERNEELLKLRKKITSTVEVLTHLKEKLQFVQGENGVLKGRLREVEEKAGKKRDILSRTKQARDALRIDNQRLRQNCGLLGNEALLRDFEERKDEGDDLREKLERLKMQHAELTLNLNGVRRKIDQAKVGAT